MKRRKGRNNKGLWIGLFFVVLGLLLIFSGISSGGLILGGFNYMLLGYFSCIFGGLILIAYLKNFLSKVTSLDF